MPVTYPTNQYTTINTTVDNIADFREKRISPITETNGLTTLTRPTRTLYDLAGLSGDDLTDYLWVLGATIGVGQIGSFVTALTALNVKDRNYFTKEKQIKILRLTERTRKVAFELQRLRAECAAAGSSSTQQLPLAPESKYPSSQSIRSFRGR